MTLSERRKQLTRHTVLKTLELVVDAIAGLLGSQCEVALHDLRDLSASIIKIANGHVTGRRIGGGMTDYGLTMIKSEVNNLFFDYSARTMDGRQLKSAGIVFRDEDGEPLAMLCINWDTSSIVDFERLREVLLPLAPASTAATVDETFHEDVGSTLQEISQKIFDSMGIPPRLMKKEDRVEVVTRLEERGFFMIKGAVNHLARRFGISKFSIYAYLEEVRGRDREENGATPGQTTS